MENISGADFANKYDLVQVKFYEQNGDTCYFQGSLPDGKNVTVGVDADDCDYERNQTKVLIRDLCWFVGFVEKDGMILGHCY